MVVAAVKWAQSNRSIRKHLFPIKNGAFYCVCQKSMYSSLPDEYNCKVKLALTYNGKTIVCYHPVDIPYEHTKPIHWPDPVNQSQEKKEKHKNTWRVNNRLNNEWVNNEIREEIKRYLETMKMKTQ
uniref:Large ribosomal subunit protein mL42 n=1 Tax=Rhinolophus ferrumequinum TaxID=59479 RepID=A0A671FHC3_RHIFE